MMCKTNTLDTALAATKNLFKSNNKPYSLKDGVEGPGTKIVFSEHFIYSMRKADSSECMSEMSKLEKYMYWDYLNYQGIVNGVMFDNPTYTDDEVDAAAKALYEESKIYIATEEVVRKLSDWAYAETLAFDKDSCYDIMHSWEV